MRIDILTLFPEMFSAIDSSIIKRAVENKIINLNLHNYRNYSNDKNNRVDDYSYGGGAGMVICLQPILDCLRQLKDYQNAYKILLTPSGNVYNQKKAQELSKKKHLVLVCGHYEGIDNRIIDYLDEEISIGDYILTGGEIPAMVLVDSITRLLPNVLGNNESAEVESFSNSLLEYPQYTRPEEFEGNKIPPVLISGNHELIRQYRRFKSLELTFKRRPDLLEKSSLNQEDLKFLEMIKRGEEL